MQYGDGRAWMIREKSFRSDAARTIRVTTASVRRDATALFVAAITMLRSDLKDCHTVLPILSHLLFLSLQISPPAHYTTVFTDTFARIREYIHNLLRIIPPSRM